MTHDLFFTRVQYDRCSKDPDGMGWAKMTPLSLKTREVVCAQLTLERKIRASRFGLGFPFGFGLGLGLPVRVRVRVSVRVPRVRVRVTGSG